MSEHNCLEANQRNLDQVVAFQCPDCGAVWYRLWLSGWTEFWKRAGWWNRRRILNKARKLGIPL